MTSTMRGSSAMAVALCAALGIVGPDEAPLSPSLLSDRGAKQDFAPVNPDELLEKFGDLRVEEWSYKSEPGVRHMGPMAQDFRSAFHLGSSDQTISTVDANGVSMVAIQALYKRVLILEGETTSCGVRTKFSADKR
jgi:hypothetical protein